MVLMFAWLPWKKKPKIKVSIPDFYDIHFDLPFKKEVMARIVYLHVELKNVQNPEIDTRLGITEINPTHAQPLFWAGEFASVDEGHDIASHNFFTPKEAADDVFKYHFFKAGTSPMLSGKFRRASGIVNVAVKFKGLEGFFLPIKRKGAAHIRDPGEYELSIELIVPIIGRKVKKVKIVSKEGTDLDDLQIIR